ncbi:HlyD family efflux transporter periplasmic adaptor subunit [Francisella sp. 19X1-34]|uniref:HlyD family secretion protein n=1 Tax=Francisella sp. 19X1-34 TaxID=3087177 RepID=UPI002E37D5B5|nr:HlyD family efflux transporter periplasmic adaptor subunit [Francisella sp. 19X1-34]MED7787498.1 HlyD family efflux transporter periplasmic adaptor subunit [Francisella sp. 19X1-34]
MKFKPPKNKQIMQAQASPVKKNISKLQWYMVIVIVISPLIYIGWMIFSNNWFIVADGTVVTEKYLIRAHEDGFIKQSNIHPGKLVKNGQDVFIMSSPLLNTELNEINTQIKDVKSLQDKLYKSDLNALEQKYAIAKKYVDINEKFYNAMVQLRKKNIINIIELQQSSQVLHNAEMDFGNVLVEKQQYSLEKDNNYAETLRQLNLQKSILEEKIKSLDIKIDVDAVVNRVYVYKGEFVQKGQELALLSLFDKPFIRAYLDSEFVSYVSKGTKVTIRFQDGAEFKGVIESRPVFAEMNNDRSIFDSKESKVVIIVKPTQKIPEEYNINNVPVEIDVGRL